jgi:predicted  nucleic acid-binding Zn ribbon protein
MNNKEQKVETSTEAAIVGNTVLAAVPYQCCPKCNGQGLYLNHLTYLVMFTNGQVVVAYSLVMCAMAVR